MELRDFAETILYGKSLAQDKFLQPGELTDLRPGSPQQPPSYPGRPHKLDYGSTRPQSEKSLFPTQNSMEGEWERGVMLHFFANHELLAMELMALALLRFPDAPAKFRMGIARTIVEEQKHLGLYLERMHELGVEFGEIPVNDFFWKCLSNMASPMEYVAKMSMTFEQANLDYSYFYMTLMKNIGDTKTAQILQTVYEEEIGHVKHGVTWFESWRDQSQSQWACYFKELHLPLSPARAKGQIFVPEARIRAGLNADFINELSVFSSSKGRPPDIYFFNPCCELEVARGTVGYTPVVSVKQLQQDCASLCLFLAAKDDIVLVPQKPTLAFLQTLKKCGFDPPEWQEYGDEKLNLEKFKQNILGSLCPWGWSPQSHSFLKDLSAQAKPVSLIFNELKNYKNFYSKSFSAQLTHRIRENFLDYSVIFPAQNLLPVVCTNFLDTLKTIEKLLPHTNTVVVKSPYGTAGQNMKRIAALPLSKNDENWVTKILTDHGEVIVEPWFERVADFSAQFKIENKKIIYLGETRFLTDDRGQFLGTFLGKKTNFLNEDVVKFLYSPIQNLPFRPLELLKQVTLFVAQNLQDLHFEGPCGVDTFVYRDKSAPLGFGFKFISEINPRFTMGRVALEISKRITPGPASLWLHLRLKDIEQIFGDKEKFLQHVEQHYPLQIIPSFKPQVKDGILLTNDVHLAKNTVTLLIVGQHNIDKFLKEMKKNSYVD